MEAVMPRVRSNGSIIDYDDEGLGDPALLLLPTWCSTRAAFEPVMDLLRARRRVLALDWRGHGASGAPAGDFGEEELVRDSIAVIADSGAQSVVPVALGHAGWIGIALRRRLGSDVPGLVVVDWVVSEAPAALLTTLEDLRSEADRDDAVAGLLQQWQAGVPDPALAALLADMGAASDAMWDRAAREIESSYARFGSPLRALAGLEHPPPVLHLVPAAADSSSFERQRAYEEEHHWFHAAQLPARSHLPLFEAPRRAADEIERFARRVGGRQTYRRAA
jgi:pimeloyl-ACP methyl ester carboxylesterase